MGNERVEGYAEGFRIGWDKCRNKIIKKVKSFPVGDLCSMKCTDCKGFDRFINTFTNGLIKSIEDETENHKSVNIQQKKKNHSVNSGGSVSECASMNPSADTYNHDKPKIEEKIADLEMDIFINGKDTESNRNKLEKLQKSLNAETKSEEEDDR